MPELEQQVSEQMFPPLRSEELISELNVETRARQDGKNDYPPSDAVALSGAEHTVLNAVRSKVLAVKVLANGRLGDLARHRIEIDLPATLAKLEFTSLDLEREYEQLVVETDHKLRIVKDEEEKRHRDLQLFKSENSLTREAVVPQSQLVHRLSIAAIVVVESILNAYFFSKGSDFGLVGGILQAAFISAVNVAFAMLWGCTAIRWLVHVNFPQKLMGVLALVGYAAAVISGNLLVAHYRALLESDPATAITAAVSKFWDSPFAVDNLDAWLLFAVGIAATMFALSKSLSHSDIYPGYAAVARRHIEAEDQLDAAQEDLAGQIKRRHETANREFDERRVEARKDLGRFQSLMAASEGIVFRYRQYAVEAQGVGNHILSRYREINRSIRHTAAPLYFESAVAFEDDLLGFSLDLGADKAQLQDMRGRYERFSEKLPDIKQRMSAAYSAALQTLQTSGRRRRAEPHTGNVRPAAVGAPDIEPA